MDATGETLFAYATGGLDADEVRAIEERIENSPALKREAERYEKLAVLLRAASEEEIHAPESLAGKVGRQVMLKAYLKAASGLFEGILGAYGRAVLYYLK